MECLSDILANTFDAVIVCTGEQRLITEWNSAAERVFGIPAERVINKNAVSLTSDQAFSAIGEILRDAVAAEPVQARRYTIGRADGSTVGVTVNTAVLAEDAGLAIIAREEAVPDKNSFLIDLAHQLRTPLTPVLMTAAALRKDERLPADAREQLEMIERNIALQAQAIDRVLEVQGSAKSGLVEPAKDVPAGAPNDRPHLRLLLVEDHESTLQVLSRLLARAGHQVVTASTLADALAAAKSRSFDLVISDLWLPDGTGNELMEIVRARYGLRGIALSGYGMEEDVRRARQAGFAAHLTKPVDFQQLERALEEVLQGEALQ